jgi:hypothetical protein
MLQDQFATESPAGNQTPESIPVSVLLTMRWICQVPSFSMYSLMVAVPRRLFDAV